MTCVHCLRRGGDDSGAEADIGEDNREEEEEGDADRTKLWKLILEAGSKEKENTEVG